MKPILSPILSVALLLGAALCGCAGQGQHAPTSDYVPAQGGPGYGAGGVNTVPGDRPPAGAVPQGGSGGGATGSGSTYGTGSATGPGSTYGAGVSESGAASGGAQGASSAGATSGGADKAAMCALQKRIDAAKTEQERRAIIDEALPGMTPDLRQQHLEMLRQQCH